MRVRVYMMVLGFALCGSASRAAGAPVSLLFSGQPVFLIIDGNGDGPGPGDCQFTVMYDPDTFAIVFTPQQDANLPLGACSGATSGTVFIGSDSSSDYGGAVLTSTNTEPSSATPPPLAALGLVPGIVEMIAESFSGPPDGLPMEVNQVDFRDLPPGGSRGFITLCSANGPAGQLDFANKTSLLLQFPLYPNTQNPTHVTIPSMPWQQASPNLGTFTLRDAYIPLANRGITIALQSAPSDLLVNVDVDRFAPCARRRPAPTTTEWGLIGILAGLLAFGTWRLSRRPLFYGSLPTV